MKDFRESKLNETFLEFL